MKLFYMLLSGVLAFLAACCAVQARPFPDEKTWVKHCDEIPDEATLTAGGTLTFLGTIECDTTKIIEITGNTVIRSHESLDTAGIALLVHPGAELTIRAPTINMKKGKSMQDQQPILRVLGSVDFQVTSWVKEHLEGAPVDDHGIISVEGEGMVRSDKAILFTARSVIVADPAAANKKEADPAETSMPADPHLLRKLAAMHAKSNIASDSAAPTVEDLSPQTSDPTPPAAAAATQQLADDKSSSSATSPNRPPFSTAAGPDDGDKSTAAAAANDVPAPTSPAAPSTPSSAANPNAAAGAGENVGNSPAAGASTADSMTTRAREGRDRGSTVSENGKTGSGGTGPSPIPESNSWTVRKKEASKQQHQQAPRDKNGNMTGQVPHEKHVLLKANARKMLNAQGLRSEIFEANLEKRKAALEGRELPKKGKVAALMGFLPLGKNGFRRRRAREHAEAHLGEATLSLTTKGNLEVAVDGTTVLRKSGPSWFGFRRSDSSYELRVNEEGIVISRQGKFDWSVKVEDIL
ncbi:hypothetical protein Esi_0024_0074 [Ectocarpus siliculosus]|uniref:FecR protein domain-containing protein n=1 Tax=Ectocarpus siliculosus TaxID=2880 RepID=D8LJ57_ECTSI|nr:hypothetical protein Esi_0024_0074 [Ectocarpus siliculosus]|eukprot:CBN76941.1 hypothetical protein Esi_0024_0074 [Ectocarpus siliculosus]